MVELNPGDRLEDLIRQLELELDPENTLLVINGQFAEPEAVIHDGDEIHFIPAISGG